MALPESARRKQGRHRSSEVTLAPDTVLGERYRLVRRIASGGMGSVWEAEDSVLGRRVALKVLSDALSADDPFVERFRREAQAAAGLSHPNVAGVFDYGEDHGTQFMVMELLDGETLAQRLRRGPVPPGEAVGIVQQVAAALQAAHDKGIVHRDVKPGNVMITRSEVVKVMDFGIADATSATPLTASGTTVGTATYISPEQAAGHRATPASDVYSLGVVLYELLAGRPPFTAESSVAVAAAHVSRPPPPLKEVAPSVPDHVAAACHRALAKNPAERPQSAASFAAMLAGQDATAALPLAPSEGATTEVLPALEGTAVLPSVAAPGIPAAPTRPRRVWPWVAAGSALVLAAIGVVLALVLSKGSLVSPRPSPSGPVQHATVKVPNVVGLPRDEAVKKIRDAGLRVGETVSVEGTQGIVVKTDPPAGTTVAEGRSITLYVGSSPPPTKGHRKGKGKQGGD